MINKQIPKEYRICVLGNFSGRNAGDNAILGTLMYDVSQLYENVRFVVPTFNPRFVSKHFSEYPLEVVSLLPWALSLKIFGLPTFRAVLSSDLVLVTDNILFDMKLFNPLFNYLSTLSLALPMAKKRGIPVVLYNMSLGPINTNIGKTMMTRVIQATELITLRDTQSRAMLERHNIPYGRIEQGADCAVNARPASDARLEEIIRNEGLFTNPNGTIGFNVNYYLDQYLQKDASRTDENQFVNMIAAAIDRVIEQTDSDVLFIVTQVMDIKITSELIKRVKSQDRIKVITNKNHTYQEITGILKWLEMLVAMRTHAVILASAMHTPVLGIISYPKTAGYLDSIEQNEWQIGFDTLNTETLTDIMLRLYEQRHEVRKAMRPIVEREQAKARNTAELLAPYLNPHQRQLNVEEQSSL